MSDLLPMSTPKNISELMTWSYRALLIVAIMMGLWLANQVWEAQKDGQRITSQSISSLQKSLDDIRIYNAQADGTRFTSKDWDSKREMIDGRFQEHEKRISAIETATKSITDSLGRIESKLTKP